MSQSVDIRTLLESWPYDPDKDARVVQLGNDRQVLQVRLPFGIEQYELDGRPDGQTPLGRESLLVHHLGRCEAARAGGHESEFLLTRRECAELFHEGTLYYLRYVRLFQLHDWKRTVRDTRRNLSLFDFVHRFAENAEDRDHLEQWRPYVMRIHATAAAMTALNQGRHQAAHQLLQEAITSIEALEELESETFKFERDRSLIALQELMLQVRTARPKTEIERLEERLQRAVAAQNFERAAELRDRIRALQSNSGAGD